VLANPNFLDAVTSTRYLMHLRALGGTLYLAGFFLLAWNLFRTARGAEPVNGSVECVEPVTAPSTAGVFSAPVVYTVLLIVAALVWGAGRGVVAGMGFCALLAILLTALTHQQASGARWQDWYERLLENSLPFSILTAVAVLIGGVVQILPTVLINRAESLEGVRQIPYTPLELAGRDIYVREGCYNCHSQQIRTLVGDVLRYGEFSKIGESIYDHPYQWGSKRTGPDLAREGGRYPSLWHYQHMHDPRQISPGSTMPNYPWLFTQRTDFAALPKKISVQRRLGVPYPEQPDAVILADAKAQAEALVAELQPGGVQIAGDREILALIAYLQKLGRSEPVSKTAEAH
jgi:cytochrome c oxidase cbb3-type subunit I/II